MIELWIPVTITAAFMQNLRSAVQKYLKGRLSTTGATFVRFGYGVPIAVAYVLILHYGVGLPIPAINTEFILYTGLGGITQILATFLLVYLFGLRNFAVGTAYSKTEAIQAAIFGFVLLADPLSLGAGVAILIGFVGVALISVANTELTLATVAKATFSRTAGIGLLWFAVRREWRPLGIALGTTLAISAVSFVLAPGLWTSWFDLLAGGGGTLCLRVERR